MLCATGIDLAKVLTAAAVGVSSVFQPSSVFTTASQLGEEALDGEDMTIGHVSPGIAVLMDRREWNTAVLCLEPRLEFQHCNCISHLFLCEVAGSRSSF